MDSSTKAMEQNNMTSIHLTEQQAFDKFEKIIDFVYDCYVTAPLDIDGQFIWSIDKEIHGVDKVTGAMVMDWLIMIVQDGDTLYTTRLPLG